MDNQKPPKKTDDHAKQADKLVEKVFDALGGIFGPIQTVRNAKAEATSEKIKAMANIEINELRNRAMNRFVLEEAIKQANIESITQKAVKDLTEDARPDQVENDWIAHFFN